MSYFMVDRQAYGGDYWERIEFGPFDTREEAEAFVDAGHREIDVAAQLRHRDNGRLVREVYAHPDNAAALRRIGGA